MKRRSFLASLFATAVLDPEKLLWVPGRKKIFVPPALTIAPAFPLSVGDVVTFAGRFAVHPLTKRELPMLQQFVVTAKVNDGFSVMPSLDVSQETLLW